MVRIATQCINLYYTVLQYCDTKLTYEDDSVTHAVRLCWGLLWESTDKYEFVRVYGGLWVSIGVYRSLWINMSIRMFMDVYESWCISTGVYESMGRIWGFIMDQYQYMGVYGVLWESMDKCEYTSVYEYQWEFVHVYGSLWGLWEYMRVFESLWINMSIRMLMDVYGCLWGLMGVYR